MESSTQTWRYESCAIGVATSDPEDLRWLAGFLDCGFETAPGAAPDFRVALRVDARAHDRLLEEAACDARFSIEGFANDSKRAALWQWDAAGGGELLREPKKPIFYRVSEDGAQVDILARERSRRVRVALMRVVRELTMRRVVATAGVLVHGAAVSTGAGIVLLCGPKRSGKTTLLMSLLRVPGVEYVANDRCVLRAAGGGFTVRGLPTLVSIRNDSLALFPDLAERLERIDAGSEARAPSGRPGLTPPQFRELLGAPARSAGRLAAIVFPRVTEDPARVSLRRLEPREALARFHRGLFRASHRTILGEAFVPAGDPLRSLSARDMASGVDEGVVTGVGCFECRLGGGAAPDVDECRTFVSEVSSGVAGSRAQGVA